MTGPKDGPPPPEGVYVTYPPEGNGFGARDPVSLVQQYERQERWRRCDDALARVPLHAGERILDLGCGLGDVTARLQRLGADVVGVDMNDELLGAARRLHPDLRFENLDLNALDASPLCPVDGMWAGFVAAYFPRLEATLERWHKGLAPNGWIALVEMDDLFGHTPCPTRWSRELERFYEEARTAGRYDFQSGRRLAPALMAAGFDVVHESTLEDDELSFQGPATSDVLEAWQQRLDRMAGLRTFLGPSFEEFRRDFIDALTSPGHRSSTRVVMVVARKATSGTT